MQHNIFGLLRKEARIVISDTLTAYTTSESVELQKPKTYPTQSTEEATEPTKAAYRLPSHHTRAFVVAVQVKVLSWWVTVWREACGFDDKPAREAINTRANNIYSVLTT